jgi:hypothetical protein
MPRQVLEVLGEPAAGPEPPECPFHDPALGPHDEARTWLERSNDRERHAGGFFDRGQRTLIAAIDNRALEERKSRRTSFRSEAIRSPSSALATSQRRRASGKRDGPIPFLYLESPCFDSIDPESLLPAGTSVTPVSQTAGTPRRPLTFSNLRS